MWRTGRPLAHACSAHTSQKPVGPDIFAALQAQLGLKLEPKKGPVEILVIDHAEKIPTAN
jgi:uncharacterized protein (TIGR03435 family)